MVLPWNDLEAARPRARAPGDEIAAVIMEPMMFNAGAIQPGPGYLEGVRELCDRARVRADLRRDHHRLPGRPRRAAERFGVTPDLAVYGKAMAGSWPVAALAGRAELMEPIGTGEVNHPGTFNANLMGMAAVAATLRMLAGNRRTSARRARQIALIRGCASSPPGRAAVDRPGPADGLPRVVRRRAGVGLPGG